MTEQEYKQSLNLIQNSVFTNIPLQWVESFQPGIGQIIANIEREVVEWADLNKPIWDSDPAQSGTYNAVKNELLAFAQNLQKYKDDPARSEVIYDFINAARSLYSFNKNYGLDTTPLTNAVNPFKLSVVSSRVTSFGYMHFKSLSNLVKFNEDLLASIDDEKIQLKGYTKTVLEPVREKLYKLITEDPEFKNLLDELGFGEVDDFIQSFAPNAGALEALTDEFFSNFNTFVGNISARLDTERETTDLAIADARAAAQESIDEALGRVDNLVADLSTYQTGVNTQIQSIQSAYESLNSTVQSNVSRIDATEAAIIQEATTRADGFVATTSQINAIVSRIDDVDASIIQEANTRASEDAATVDRIDQLVTRVDDNAAAIVNEQNARTTALLAEATARETLAAQLKTDGELYASGLVTSEANVRASQDEILGERIDLVSAEVGGISTAILNEQTARITGDEAEATSRKALSTKLFGTDVIDGITVDTLTSGFLYDQQQSIITQTESAVTNVTGQIAQIQTDLTNTRADLLTETTTRVNEYGAIATSVTALSTEFNNQKATLDSLNSIVSGPDGITTQWGIKSDINGYITGVGLISSSKYGTPTSQFIVYADQFALVTPGVNGGQPTLPFFVGSEQGYLELSNTVKSNWNNVIGAGKPADGATRNPISHGALSARPAGVDGEFYYANDTRVMYQKINGAWVDTSNNTYVDTNGNIQGVAAGAGLSVANNEDGIIRSPGGGKFRTTEYWIGGAIKIGLPNFFTSSMLSFAVDIFEYEAGYSCRLLISGYNYSQGTNWHNVTARVIGGSNVEYPVYFGHDGTRCCVWIGNPTSASWSYPQVTVSDVHVGFYNADRSLWENGWTVGFDTTAITIGNGANQYSNAVLDTLPGADWQKISGAGKPADGATRNVFRGDWSSSSVAYSVGDIVLQNGNGWSCVVAHTSSGANQPPASGSGNTWWTAYTVKGGDGKAGLNFSDAKLLHTDPTFQSGLNGIQVYNNSGNGTVIITREAKQADSPFGDSAYNLRILNIGFSSPYLGGFTFWTPSRANAQFVVRIIAKLPVGHELTWHSNPIGTGAETKWLSSSAGTGRFEEYLYFVRCGSEGTFSSTNYFALNGPAYGTPGAPINWYLAYATVYDFTALGLFVDVVAATASANAANAALADIAADNKLTAVEKQSAANEWGIINRERASIRTQADALGISQELWDYDYVYAVLNDYITPLLQDISNTSAIDGATFRDKWSYFYEYRQRLLNKMAAVAATKADWASVQSRPDDPHNLCTKSSFEDGKKGAWVGGSVSVEVANTPWSSKALLTQARDAFLDDWFSVTPGEKIEVEAALLALYSNHTLSVGIHVVDKLGANITWLAALSSAPGEAWAIKAGTITIPANASKARCWVQMGGDSGFGYGYVTNLRYRRFTQITSSNVTTYIANAAIGAAQIGSINLVGTSNFAVKTATSGARMDMDSRRIKIYDAAGILRVQLGDLTV